MNPTQMLRKINALAAMLALSLTTITASAATPHVMSAGDYTEDFSDIANWANGFTAGIGAEHWGTNAINATGTVPDGVRITTGTANFSTGSSGGVQRGTNNLVLLTTGTTDSTTAVAVDLFLDFTGRNAGTISFDWLALTNSTGNRAASLRVYTSTDGATFTEVVGAAVLNQSNNVPASGAITAVALPTSFNGSSTARIRFYEYNGDGGSVGSRAKIAIDNLVVTSTGVTGTPPNITDIQPSSISTNAGATVGYTVTSTGDAPTYFWYHIAGGVTNLVSGAITATLTLSDVLEADNGFYFVVLSNASGTATSSQVSLDVTDPAILVQPKSVNILEGQTATFSVVASGTPPLSYVWYKDASPLSDGGDISGATSDTLQIANVESGDMGTYHVDVGSPAGTNTSQMVSLNSFASGALAKWNFNGAFNTTSPAPSDGLASALASVVTVTGFSNPAASGLDFEIPNSAWGTSGYPPQGTSNKLAGVQFAVSTVGARNLSIAYDTRASATASKYTRVQFTTNGTDWIDYPVSSAFFGPNVYEPRSFSLVGFPGVANNPDFALRIVAEFESTATYGALPDATNYVGVSSTYGTGGTLSYDLVTINAESITNANQAPTITSFSNIEITDLSPATNVSFTVGDAETAIVNLVAFGSSKNTGVLSDPVVIGSGATRSLQITPSAGQTGIVPIVVTVTDEHGNAATTWFYVTVTPGNQEPTISTVLNTNTLVNTPITIGFTVGDDQTPVGSLTPSGTSGNQTLVPDANITFGGSGSNRSVTITPATDEVGLAPITISISDGEKITSTTFALIVRSSTQVIFSDGFDYDTTGSIVAQSSYWTTHSGSAGQMQVGSGVVTVSQNSSEDVNALLIDRPYDTNDTLYSSFTVNFTTIPEPGGTYFAHFKEAGTFGFLARVWASSSNAPPGTFRILIANSSGTLATAASFPQDLVINSNYTVVTRLVLSNGFSTLWINPSTEGSTSVTDTTPVATIPDIHGYALRQAFGFGIVNIDDMTVATTFAAATGTEAPSEPPVPAIITGLSRIATPAPFGSMVFSGTNGVANGTYYLLSSTNITAPLTNWVPVTTNLFDGSGAFVLTNAIDPTKPRLFFNIAQPTE